MKKLMIVLCASAMSLAAARAECIWSWWTNSPAENASKEVKGCALGLASEVKSINGAQVSLLFNKTDSVGAGAQVAIGYNNSKTVKNGVQGSFVNVSDAASLQLGLLNFNKKGFLPFFPFFNFATTQFGSNAQ